MLEYIILGFLMCGETSGYDLKQWMSKSTSYFFDASFGSIYPALKRLTQKNMTTFHEVVEGSKYKKVYRITDAGKKAFMEWIEEPIAFEKSRQDHLVKIFFYEFLPKETAIERLKNLVSQVELVFNELKDQKTEVEQQYDVYQFCYRYEAMRYGIGYYSFVLDWCNELIDNLENNPKYRGER